MSSVAGKERDWLDRAAWVMACVQSVLLIWLAIPMLVKQARQTAEPPLAGPFRPRPRPPQPPVPPPEPQNEEERRLFERIRAWVETRAEQRAEEKVNEVLLEVSDELDRAAGLEGPQPFQGPLAAAIAAKIVALVKKVAEWVVMGVVGAAILALAYQLWPWLVAGFIAAVSLVAWPAGWAAGKLTGGKS